MKASVLLRQNIKAILKARGQTAHDLALWCRMDDSWISKILSDGPEDRAKGIPLKHLDRIADFFGIATYQLFQPGSSPLTERRSGHDRRSGMDRRISGPRLDLPRSPARRIAVTPEDEGILAELHALDYDTYQRVKAWITVAKLGVGSGRKTAPPAEASPADAPRSSGVRRPRGKRAPQRKEPPTD